MTFHESLSGRLGACTVATAAPAQGWVALDADALETAGLHAPLARAAEVEPSAPSAPMSPPSLGGGPPRRVPAQDIVVIGRSRSVRLESEAVFEVSQDGKAVLTVPRLPLRRLAFRAFLVALLIGEIALAAMAWPREPIPVPDASRPGNMIG